jgi:hypothetical protein
MDLGLAVLVKAGDEVRNMFPDCLTWANPGSFVSIGSSSPTYSALAVVSFVNKFETPFRKGFNSVIIESWQWLIFLVQSAMIAEAFLAFLLSSSALLL